MSVIAGSTVDNKLPNMVTQCMSPTTLRIRVANIDGLLRAQEWSFTYRAFGRPTS